MKLLRLPPYFLSLFLLLALCQLSHASASPAYQYALQWPAAWDFASPKGAAVDGAGNVYVADSGNGRIQILSPGGALITVWGTNGAGDGQFSDPRGVAVDVSGNVYVADTGNNRIQKFDKNGVYITKWGSAGSGNGQFQTPSSLSVDGSGNIFVAEAGGGGFPLNNRIQKFTADGVFITTWGGRGTGNGQFKSPYGVAVDKAGENVYVMDTGNNRIQKFDGSGGYKSQWNSSGTAAGSMNLPWGIALDGGGNLYAADAHRILKFTTDGAYVTTWGSLAEFTQPAGVAADSGGNVYVTDAFNSNIQKFSVSGATATFVASWNTLAANPLNYPSGVAVDRAVSNHVYVADSPDDRIMAYDGNGGYLFQWGGTGPENGKFAFPSSLTVDSAGAVYVVDEMNNRIQKFTVSGSTATVAAVWGGLGAVNGQFNDPTGVAVDSAGNVFVSDGANNRVQQFTVSGATATFVREWGTSGSTAGQFFYPSGVAADSKGNVYVLDRDNNRVQKFTVTAGAVTFVREWGAFGTDPGQLNSPAGISVDGADNVYVADSGNDRLQKFDGNGVLLEVVGRSGNNNGEFITPKAISMDNAGNLFVADAANNRIQKFSPPPAPPQVMVSVLGAGSVVSTPAAINCPSGSCVASFDPSQFPLTLSATPDPGNNFTAWGGDCSSCGTNPSCQVTLPVTTVCTATFAVIPPPANHNLFITLDGGVSAVVGSVQVTTPGSSVSCDSGPCTYSYVDGTVVTLEGKNGANALFTGWSGAWCSGTTPCILTMLGDRPVTALFAVVKPVRLERGGVKVADYDTLTAAYAAAQSGDTIKARAQTFPESLTLGQAKTGLIVQGGYDLNYSSPPTGYSILKGLTVSKGAATVGRLIVQ